MPQDPILSEDDQDGDEVVGEASVFTQSLIQQKLYEKVKSTENKARRRKKIYGFIKKSDRDLPWQALIGLLAT